VKIIYKGKSVLVICTIPIPYNIKGWNSGSHIGENNILNKLKNDKILCDVTLIAEGKYKHIL
jgi:hypothetical protein